MNLVTGDARVVEAKDDYPAAGSAQVYCRYERQVRA
jgi:hypothetical protein